MHWCLSAISFVYVFVVVVVRWLQPERSVDMNSIDIQIPEGEHQLGKDVSVNIVIKDQTGTVVAVPDMQVRVCLSVCLSVSHLSVCLCVDVYSHLYGIFQVWLSSSFII